MNSSTYQQPLPHELESIAATGYRPSGKAVSGRWHVYPEMAAAGLWTTPSDLARYVDRGSIGIRGQVAKVLSQKMVKQMLTKQADGVDGPIGLGPFVHEAGDSRYFEHDGGDDGFVCKFVGYLDRGQGASRHDQLRHRWSACARGPQRNCPGVRLAKLARRRESALIKARPRNETNVLQPNTSCLRPVLRSIEWGRLD